MTAYASYHEGKMSDYVTTDEELEARFALLPKVD